MPPAACALLVLLSRNHNVRKRVPFLTDFDYVIY